MSHYTATEVLTIVGALGVLLTAVGAVIVNIIVALRTSNKLDENVKEVKAVGAQVAEVHTLTNSGLAAVKAELAISAAKNDQLLEVISDLKQEREKLAVLTAQNTKDNPALAIQEKATESTEKLITSTEKVLGEIEVNTDRTVEELKKRGK